MQYILEGAVVTLERTMYHVSEDVGMLNVCAIVNFPTIPCPIEFSFIVSLSTTGISAGNVLVTLYALYIYDIICLMRTPSESHDGRLSL